MMSRMEARHEEQEAGEGDLLWTPPETFMRNSQLNLFTQWLNRERGHAFSDYEELWRWSVTELDLFWSAVWDYFEVISDSGYAQVRSGTGMEHTRWFPGTRTNYAEHLLRHEARAAEGEVALVHSSEIRPLRHTSWQSLGGQVRRLAKTLRTLGVQPGDRIVAYMPNVEETAVAMLATIAVGAIWSAASPEFGAATVIERFRQIEPKLAFMTDGYSFNGKIFDKRVDDLSIAKALPSLKTVVWLNYVGLEAAVLPGIDVLPYASLLDCPDIPRSQFQFERVTNDHPLWILFSSGTTGLPKPIVHSHVGMIVDHLKVNHFTLNLSPRSRNFFYTTTGWMMFNTVVSSLITGASAVLYDGSPTFGGIDALWRIAATSRATVFGASPTLVKNMKKAGVSPGRLYDLAALEMIMVGGAPSPPEIFSWFYQHIRRDLWVTSSSGGTDICSGFVGGVPTRPVYAGEIGGRVLGMDVHAWSDDGNELIDEIGELVVTSPFPCQPLCFWNDEGGRRYRESYFEYFDGVWRHGDWIKINTRGGAYIYGRSDSTLNRHGVRIGSAEIYRVVEQVEGVRDSLVVCCETRCGGYYMPLFIELEPNSASVDSIVEEIVTQLREQASPRHVPDEIHTVPEIPYTLSGKKMEVPVRKIMMGLVPEQVASRDAMANPGALDWFIQFAAQDVIAARRLFGAEGVRNLQ